MVVGILFLLLMIFGISAGNSERGMYLGKEVIGPVSKFRSEAFLGIPYAEPPIGELRFQKPIPKSQKNPIPTIEYGKGCISITQPSENQSEDCLTLNIIKPFTEAGNTHKYPVLIWIHGGSFLSGASSDYSVDNIIDNLVSEGIIFVSLNYRLGPYAFISNGIYGADGNLGLWDQLTAIEFIFNNIETFNGNKSRISIWGQSAGAASVSWLSLHSKVNSRISNAIQMSGSVASAWAHSQSTVRYSRSLIAILECDQQLDVMGCVKNKSDADIRNASQIVSILASDQHYFSILYHPWFDKVFISGKSSFNEALINAKKHPLLIGINDQEGIPFIFDPNSPLYLSPEKVESFGKEEFTEIVSQLLMGENCFEDKEKVAQKIVEFYASQSLQYSHHAFVQTFVQLLSDTQFNIPIMREILERVKYNQKVFVVRNGFVRANFSVPWVDGLGHAGELYNYFGPELPQRSEEAKIQDILLETLVNFVKHDVPILGGTQLKNTFGNEISYFDIKNATSATPSLRLWSERILFWDLLFSDFGYDWPTGTCNNEFLQYKK